MEFEQTSPEPTVSQTERPKYRSRLHQVTPLSKYLAMALFIILPFVGGYVGYMYAPEKVVEVERVVIQEPGEISESEVANETEDIVASNEIIIFPNSQELSLELPVGWEYIQPNVYDDEGRVVFSLSYPIREVGYEPLDAANVRDITTSSGLEFRVVDRVEREDRTIGFAHYMHSGDDFFSDSFEIMVRFNDRGHYVSSDMQPGDYIATRYKSYTAYLAEEEYIQDIIEGIKINEDNTFSEGFSPENVNWMIESGDVTVYQGDRITVAVANVAYDIVNTDRVVVSVNDGADVLDAVLAGLESQGKITDYVDRSRIEVMYTSDVYSGGDIIMLR